MESPHSEKSQTRFSTPVSDLDDHRNQTSTRPRGETAQSVQSPRIAIERRASSQNSASHTRSDLKQIQEGLALHNGGSVSRDFEQAVIDDDRSGTGENLIDQNDSLQPGVLRRSTVRRSQNQPNHSRDSSTSSSSSDNSVDAFADPRRRERAGTIGSKAPSDLDVGLQRTVSGGTHCRRPTFSSHSVRDPTLKHECDSVHAPADDDVCFPTTDEAAKRYAIDFEELDDFVAEFTKAKASASPHVQRVGSTTSQGHELRVFDDLRPQVHALADDSSSPALKPVSDSILDDGNATLNEKHGDHLGKTTSKENLHGVAEASRYSFFSSELEQTIHAAEFVDLLAPGETWRDLFDLPEDSGVWWLDVLNPKEEELHVFQRAFGIHRLTTEDIITQEAREKVELFKQYYFVCFRSFFQDDVESDMEPVNVYMVVFREGILTITYQQSPHAGNVRQRIGKLRDYMALTADWICYAMIDNIVDCFAPPIHKLEVEADTIEDQVFVARSDDFDPLLREIGTCRKKVMSLMRLLGGKADVIKGFAKRCNESYNVTPRGEIGLYLGDIQDHVVTMMSNLGHFEKMLSRSHSNYLAQLSVDHIRQGNRANEVLSKITLLASILVPLNLICGLFGMNVPVPGRATEGYGWFFGILGVIAVIVLVSLVAARRMRFI